MRLKRHTFNSPLKLAAWLPVRLNLGEPYQDALVVVSQSGHYRLDFRDAEKGYLTIEAEADMVIRAVLYTVVKK